MGSEGGGLPNQEWKSGFSKVCSQLCVGPAETGGSSNIMGGEYYGGCLG